MTCLRLSEDGRGLSHGIMVSSSMDGMKPRAVGARPISVRWRLQQHLEQHLEHAVPEQRRLTLAAQEDGKAPTAALRLIQLNLTFHGMH
jgi:hypothetical protein